MSKSDTRSEEYYQQFLNRVVAACDGKGGAVWLVARTSDGKSEFQLAAQMELESSKFQTDEAQRTLLLRALSEVVQGKKPVVLPADAPVTAGAAPGSLQAQLAQMSSGPAPQTSAPNRTPYPFIHVPMFLKEQVLGVLQVWLQPYVTKENYAEFATFLAQLATHAENHFQTRRMGNMVVENQRLQQLLKFITDLTGTLDPGEAGRLAANYSRDLLGCERCAVVRRSGSNWQMISISGQEVVEKKSSMVKVMTAFIKAHTPTEPIPIPPDSPPGNEIRPYVIGLGKKELLALANNGAEPAVEVVPPTAEGAAGPTVPAAALPAIPDSRLLMLQPHGSTAQQDADYYDLGQVSSSLLVQLLDAEKHVVGVLLAESTVEGFFEQAPTAKEPPPSHRLAEWISGNTGRALKAALDYKELPLLFATRRARDARRWLFGSKRLRRWFWLLLWLFVFWKVLFYPLKDEVQCDCTLVPERRVKVVPEVPGRIDRVFVREGALVKKGDKLAQLDTSALDAELKHSREEMVGAQAEVEKYRGASDPASEQIAQTKVRAAQERINRLQQDLDSATLRAPIDGTMLTKDLELTEGVYLQAGADFAVIGTMDKWDLQVHVPEKQVGDVEKWLDDHKEVDVQFILYSHSSTPLRGVLKDRSQISQVAYPHQKENAIQESTFILTLPQVEAPAYIKSGFRPDLTGRASITIGHVPLIVKWYRDVSKWYKLKWMW